MTADCPHGGVRGPSAPDEDVARAEPYGPYGPQTRVRRQRLTMDLEARKVIEMGYGGSERLTMNMGPQHPSAHGVFRAILTLEGETVVAVDAVIGYLHRCHEKLGESLTYTQYPSIASKTDYVAAMTSELAYVRAAEIIGKIDVPQARAVPARDRGGAAARRLALPLARHLVHGHGRGARGRRHRVPLLHPRARDRARSLRGARRRAAALRPAPGGRRALRHPGGMGQAGPRHGGPDRAAHRRVRGHARAERLLPRPHPGGGGHLAGAGAGGRHLGAARPRLRRELRHPARRALLLLRGLRLQGARGDRGRLLRALPRADGRVPRVHQDRAPGPRRAARGADLLAPGRQVGGAGAHSQGRGLCAGRRARAARWAATSSRTAPPSPIA